MGHSTIKDNKNKKSAVQGLCYNVNLEGISKGTREEVGSLIACINQDSQIGYVYYNSDYGIFGQVDRIEEDYQEVETECWYNVKLGKANILIALDGEELRSYEVEITGIDYINKNKNIKVKVTDKELIAKTGGIVQGMSGTPLMQDGKLVGAINYVAQEDPRTAYAIFVDKLI